MAKKKTLRKRSVSQQKKEDEQRNIEWNARDDLGTLRKAEEIKSDSLRLANAEIVAQEEMDALKKVVKRKRSGKKKVV